MEGWSKKMSIDVKANEIAAENSASVHCKQRTKTIEMKGSKKGMFEQCKWFTTFPKENRTSKFLNWYMS